MGRPNILHPLSPESRYFRGRISLPYSHPAPLVSQDEVSGTELRHACRWLAGPENVISVVGNVIDT